MERFYISDDVYVFGEDLRNPFVMGNIAREFRKYRRVFFHNEEVDWVDCSDDPAMEVYEFFQGCDFLRSDFVDWCNDNLCKKAEQLGCDSDELIPSQVREVVWETHKEWRNWDGKIKEIQDASIDEIREFVDWCGWQPEYINEEKTAGERWKDYKREGSQ